MCGRFLITAPIEALRLLFQVPSGLNLEARYNLAPTQSAPVLRLDAEGQRALSMLRWGLIPSWAKDATIGAKLINARADTVATKPSFRAAFRQRRCLVPVDGFYEWQEVPGSKAKQPYLICRAGSGPGRDGSTFVFAGLWERWVDGSQPVETFTIITTDANATLAPIHHRMPVVIAPGDFAAWLDHQNKDAEALLRPAPDDLLQAIPVSTRVNSVRNDDAGLVEPVTPIAAGAAPAAAKPAKAKPPSAQGSLF